MSPFLTQPLRSETQALADYLDGKDLYFVITSGPQVYERAVLGKDALIQDIASGELRDPKLVLHGAIGEKLIDVTEDIARAVLDYRDANGLLLDEEGEPKKLPEFVTEVLSEEAENAVEEARKDWGWEQSHRRFVGGVR